MSTSSAAVQVIAYEDGDDAFGARIELRFLAAPMGVDGQTIVWSTSFTGALPSLDLAEQIGQEIIDEVRRLRSGLRVVDDPNQVVSVLSNGSLAKSSG